MGLILDTCVFIRAEKQGNAIDFAQWLDYGGGYISAITATELLMGVHRANSEDRKLRRSAYVETVLAHFPVLNFTLETARIHAEVSSYLRKAGQEIGAHDSLIAASAIEHGFALLTYNLSEFNRVPGLKVVIPI